MQIPNKKFYYFDTLYLDSANVRKIFDICKYYFKNIFY